MEVNEIKPLSYGDVKTIDDRGTKRKFNIFLAGTIDMGSSNDWQTDMFSFIKGEVTRINSTYGLDVSVDVFNPRRDDWDNSWGNTIEDENFVNQVEWELSAIDNADLVIFNIEENSKSPITLMEFGYVVGKDRVIVDNNIDVLPSVVRCRCPSGFYRSGNVVLTGRLADIEVRDEPMEVFKHEVSETLFVMMTVLGAGMREEQ